MLYQAAMLSRALTGGFVVVTTGVLAVAQANNRSEGTSAQHESKVVLIYTMANASKPSELDFQGGRCEIDQAGRSMMCQFEQVLINSSDDPQTCTIYTNHYERTFERQSATRWVSKAGPSGVCGVVDVTTLQRDPASEFNWTMETRKIVTNRGAAEACKMFDETPERLDTRNTKRPLSCKFVNPVGLGQ